MTKVKVTLRVVSRGETGETFVIPSNADIEEMKALELAAVDQQIDARAGDSSSAHQRAIDLLNQSKSEIEVRYKRWLKDCADALPQSREVEFELKKPDFGEQRRAYSAAQKIDYENVESRFDNSEYQYRLLVAAFEGKEDKVGELDPAVAAELTRRVYRMVHPDPKRLPFVAGPPSKS